jgi:hypothetical protein
MRLTYSKGSNFKFFEDYYIGVLLEREAETHAQVFRENRKTIGYRGEQFMEQGYIFAPYIPMQLEPQINGRIYDKEVLAKYANKKIDKSRYKVFSLGELTHGAGN